MSALREIVMLSFARSRRPRPRVVGSFLALATILSCVAPALVPAARAALVLQWPGELAVVGSGGGIDQDILQSALSHDLVRDRHLVVWATRGAAGASSLSGATLGASDLAAPSPVLAIDAPRTTPARDPAAAFDPATLQHLVVWSQEEEPGAFEVFGRLVRDDGSAASAVLRISDAGSVASDPSFDAFYPEVAADENGGFLVVWSSDDDRGGMADGDHEIFVRRVEAAGGTLGPIQRLTTTAPTDGLVCLRPTVGYQRGLDRYVVVHERDVDTGSAYAPNGYVVFVPSSGVLAKGAVSRPLFGGPVPARVVPPYAWDLQVSVARNDDDFLVAYRSNGGSGALVSTRVEVVTFSAAGSFLDGGIVSDPNGTLGPHCRVTDPAVTYSWTADSWIVTWAGSSFAGPACPQPIEIHAAVVNGGGAVEPVDPLVVSTTSSLGADRESLAPSIAASQAGSGAVFAMWGADRGTADSFDLWAQLLGIGATVDVPDAPAPRELALRVAPNPFNPATRVELALPVPGRADVVIYDARGQRVRSLAARDFTAGVHTLRWDGRDDGGVRVASGVYHLRVVHPAGTSSTKLVMVE